ncbi:hypothetical protein [Bacillus sp. KH172YL63]|uniref:hypothetical protein n=1 Tax=Bacillus sp. KH172YL63 TaxID=2709784 RepID=UPI0013E504C5|nr:hypothetical protein [Bacillus sp. KH172YL63]BCB03517.1 hypothetical protein KH172YL63_16500 [Bacillus sp. KH172YL63]
MKKQTYTADQAKAMYWLSLPKKDRWTKDEDTGEVIQLDTLEKLSVYLGCHRNTLYKWRKEFDNEDFMKEVIKNSIGEAPEVIGAIIREAKAGKGKQQELFLKMTGAFKDVKEIHNRHYESVDVDEIKRKAERYAQLNDDGMNKVN